MASLRPWVVGLAVVGLACATGHADEVLPPARPTLTKPPEPPTPTLGEHASEPPTTASSGSPPAEPVAAAPAPDPALESLDEHQRAHIQEWLDVVGEPRPEEGFGPLVVRSARHKLGAPYRRGPQAEEEVFAVDVDALDCVTLIETSYAVARCAWQRRSDVGCFVDELRQTRYRDGRIDGYASRLHYFEDWMADNERRGRLRSLGDELGARPTMVSFHFMTKHPRLYPALRDSAAKDALRGIEQRLSETPWPMVPLGHIDDVQHLLRDGDVLAFVHDTPGLGVTHTGLVSLDDEGIPRMIHATDTTERVTLTRCDVATCARRKKQYGRRGVIVMRPLPPPTDGPEDHALTRAAPAAPHG